MAEKNQPVMKINSDCDKQSVTITVKKSDKDVLSEDDNNEQQPGGAGQSPAGGGLNLHIVIENYNKGGGANNLP